MEEMKNALSSEIQSENMKERDKLVDINVYGDNTNNKMDLREIRIWSDRQPSECMGG
jgi:hypothetical protein